MTGWKTNIASVFKIDLARRAKIIDSSKEKYIENH